MLFSKTLASGFKISSLPPPSLLSRRLSHLGCGVRTGKREGFPSRVPLSSSRVPQHRASYITQALATQAIPLPLLHN